MSPISFSFLFNTLSTGTIYTAVGRASKEKQACVYGFIQLKRLFSLENCEFPGTLSAFPVSRFWLGGHICIAFWIFSPHEGAPGRIPRDVAFLQRNLWYHVTPCGAGSWVWVRGEGVVTWASGHLVSLLSPARPAKSPINPTLPPTKLGRGLRLWADTK